ncbi:NAD-dependent succinate-semialdehyde dehydrogenase [Sinorhizobium mexicanum]|uniref:NAD-dependent succinate-semialdehyde dehydrogenase n=1 Tax=Sinorhizobium mexicanum TaxID=375549 RepID=A0A859QKK4_9HYPH|nr:NAD-dependent succinate-semialdehyde dehydrogenase [Sinorhizobium mexicanum]MBP1888185.1 succinate-semialdehyde dehydrogenase/glutarate-semialdehyde dehydrogenase [Sinorhizobium mexicanum]QLL62970.1 NAD-dependent succinate-semialdehyde dehydrogenase [Sinorhizobium mexicanum]
MTDYKAPLMFIAGEWTRGSGQPTEVINPATEEILSSLPRATADDLDRALASAQKGFERWRSMSAEARCDIVMKGCRILRERADEIAPRITLEQGKPVGEAKLEIIRAASIVEWDVNEGRRAYGTIVPSDPGFNRFGLRLPIGPVAAFTPWNFPISSPGRKIGAALGAGCSVVIKGSEETPASVVALVECLLEGGLPADVINLVFGEPAMVSSHLIASPIIRAITFTGSIPVGKHLAQQAAAYMKPAVMELGGHSPVIVFDDVDPAVVAKQGVAGKFRNAGQICTAPTRFIVQDKVHDAFVDSFVTAAKALRVGNGLEEGVQMGPLANPRRLQALEGFVADAVAKGAKVAAGGNRIGNRGYFFEPTVLTDIPEDADVINLEPFGPIAPVIRFSDFEEAIAIANRLPYGLCSYAFTSSQARSYELAHRVESGIMSLNHYGTSQADTPFGGVKESGYGREGGYETLDAFMITKFISQKVSV